jgi:hypothetical protein
MAGRIFEGTTKSACVKTMKHFSSSLKLLQNKLVCLSLKYFQAGLIFAGKVKSL